MFVSRVNVTFHDSDRVVTEDFRARRQVDPLLGHACREGVTWNANGTLAKPVITDPFDPVNNQSCSFGYDDLVRIKSGNTTPARCGFTTVWA
jgi:hypothetical protein